MLKRFVLAILTFCLFCCGQSDVVSAVSSSLVISQVQAGSVSSSRLIEIYNNSDTDQDITGWKLYRTSASDISQIEIYSFGVVNVKDRIILPARSYIGIVSTQVGLVFDASLMVSMGNGVSGHLYLSDGNNSEVDRVAWGTSDLLLSTTPKNPEGIPIELGLNKVIERRSSSEPGILIDTDNNSSDFFQSTLRASYKYDSWYEAEDWCSNIEGIQSGVPIGNVYYDEDNSCSPPPVDTCSNIDGMQVNVPPGYGKNDLGDCLPDVCLNLDGVQIILPNAYQASGDNCFLDLPTLVINELLPNPEGDDTGNEYIEIYNPNNFDVGLENYRIVIGLDNSKKYSFPIGSSIKTGEYLVINNDTIKYTLTNTSSKVTLSTADDKVVSEANVYYDAEDGMSWSLFGDAWQYTNRLTPGKVNQPSLEEAILSATNTALKPCAPNQYRNPETNRCKLIPTESSSLVPCKVGQYRSEETNRCRNILQDAGLTLCPEGQERNPDTNRCRSILGVMDMAPFAVEPIAVKQTTKVDNWVLLGIFIMAIIYALWEWREEFKNTFNKFTGLLSKTKIH